LTKLKEKREKKKTENLTAIPMHTAIPITAIPIIIVELSQQQKGLSATVCG